MQVPYQRLQQHSRHQHVHGDDQPIAPCAAAAAAVSSASAQLGRLHAAALLCVCFLWSLLIAAGVRCHPSLAAYLHGQLPGHGSRPDFQWLGCSYGLAVFLFVPLWSGLIELFKVSYRVCAVAVGLLALLAGVVSAGVQDPGYLVVTDVLMAGTASSLALATLALVVDDHFPDRSPLRVFATTFVQGNSLAALYLVAAFSRALPVIGWRGAFYAIGGCHCGLAALAAPLFVKRPERRWQLPQRLRLTSATGGGSGGSVIDKIHDSRDWPHRLLCLAQEDFDSSRTVLLWLLERLIAATISDGMFMYLLLRSGMLDRLHALPGDTTATPSPSLLSPSTATSAEPADPSSNPATAVALAFSAGSCVAYVAGGVLGGLARGRLLVVYMVGCLTVLCSLIGWLGVAGDGDGVELALALSCGLGVGAFTTFSYAASEEATGVPARSMFPFTKVVNAVSMVTLEATRAGLRDVGLRESEVLLALLLLLSVAQLSVQLLVRRVNARRHRAAKRRPPACRRRSSHLATAE